MMIKVRALETLTEIEYFQNAFQAVSGNQVGMDYLNDDATETVGYFSGRRLVGGYCLRLGPNLRYRSMMENNEHPWPEDIDPGDSVEITCAWLEKRSLPASVIMFADAARRIQRFPVKHVVAGSRIPAVIKLHRRFLTNSMGSAWIESGRDTHRWEFYSCLARDFSPRMIFTEGLRRCYIKIVSRPLKETKQRLRQKVFD